MCPEDSFIKLQKSAHKLDQHLKDVKKTSKNLTEYQLLLMAALNLTNEYITYQESQAQFQEQVSAFVEYFTEKKLPS
jgi:cell division protein ZapA